MRIEIDFRSGRLLIDEANAENVLEIVKCVKEMLPALKEIKIVSSREESSPLPIANGQSTTGDVSRVPPMRDFARSFQLTSVYQKVAVLAYHAIKVQGRPFFFPKEMDEWFTLAGFAKPKTPMSVVIFDSKRRYGFVEKRGQGWTIAPGGENFVLELTESQGKRGLP